MGLSEDFINRYNNLELFEFVHIPKCVGQFFAQFFDNDPQIKYLGHTIAKREKNFVKRKTPLHRFTIIREPIQRFESFLNFALTTRFFQKDIPIDILLERDKPYFDLNYVVENLSNLFIREGEGMFRNYDYWTQGSDYIFTIGQFKNLYGKISQDYSNRENNPKINLTKNKSQKKYGQFHLGTKNRLSIVLKKDIDLFNKIKSQDF